MSADSSIGAFEFGDAATSSKLAGLLRMMRGYWSRYTMATLSLGLAALLKTGTYLLLRFYIDTYLVAESEPVALPVLALGFVGIAAFEGTFTYLSGRLAAQTAEGVAQRLRNYVYDHLQHLPFRYHDGMQTGELVSRSTSDVDAIRRFFAEQAIGAGRIILLFAVNLGALLLLHAGLAWRSVLVVPVIVVISLSFFGRISKLYEAYQQQEATLSTTLQENLSGVRVVRAFARQDHEREKFEVDNWEKFERGRKVLMMHSIFWPLTDILLGIQLLSGYYLAARMAIGGQITIGTYLAYSGILIWLIFPMRSLGRLIVQMSTGMVSFGRVREVLEQGRESLDAGSGSEQQPIRGEVEFRSVSLSYDGDHEALRDVSLHVRPGETVALLGSTGSGKTSLVNLLPRFYDYTGGEVLLDSRPLNGFSRRFLRSQIGIVEQEPFLFSRTIGENIAYGVGEIVSQEDIENAARAAAIDDVINSFPNGYDTLVGERGVTLSGGQKQRVAIARTILKDPRILILDDAMSSVDSETELEIRRSLAALRAGRTTFIIAHRVQSAMEADQVLVFDHGRIIEHGTHKDLLAKGGIYARVFEMQARMEVELEKDITSVSG